MILNYIWVSFFIVSFVIASCKLIFLGDVEVFPAMIKAAFDMAKTAALDIALGLVGILTFFLGIMKIGEKSGVIAVMAKLVGPFFQRLFPGIPKDHPVTGHIIMNLSATMLGLDNASTPLGLKAMQGMQELNPDKETATNAQIMFLVLNTAGLMLIPISIMTYRAQLGAHDPSDVFIPILISTFTAAMGGVITVCIYQKINIFDKVLLAYFGAIILLIAGIIYYFSNISQERIGQVSALVSNLFLFLIIVSFVTMGLIKKLNVFETFIEGAKEGFETAVKIIPYLVGILVAIAIFRACGAMDYFIMGLTSVVGGLGLNTDFIPAMPVAFMKPLSGGGARAMMIDAMKTHGADSFVGRLASILQGSCDTTFYILAVYFGSVGIKKTRYAVTCGLIADLCGVIAAVSIAYLFFH